MNAGLLATVALDVVVIVALARLVGHVFQRIGQPAVVGEILFGVLAGPTLLGASSPELAEELLPTEARTALKTIGEVALLGFVFHVGLELDRAVLRRARGLSAIALPAALVPFALGVGLAVMLYETHGQGSGFTRFALFIGAALSITAFPVLARILVGRGMERTELGALALGCAALNDLLGWTLVAVLVASLEAQAGWGVAAGIAELVTLGLLLGLPVRRWVLAPLADRMARRRGSPGWALSATVGIVAACAWSAQVLGTDPIIGAFAAGALWPRRESDAGVDLIGRRLLPVCGAVLPLAFFTPGLDMEFNAPDTAALAEFAVIMLFATVGKLAGASGSARLLGIRWRPAIALGVLMNTRGLMELIVLNIGLAAGVLDAQLYTMFVVMALATTVLTGPALGLLYRQTPRPRRRDWPPLGARMQSPIPLRW